MKMLWRAVGMLIVLGLFSSSGWCAQKLSPGEAVLQKAARAYQELKTYQAEVATIVNMTMQGMEQKISIQSRLVIERPNRLAILAKTEVMFGNTCISD